MNTTCPKCSTSFRVTSEQLAAREGKVRCGRCTHVFNGFMYLGTPIEPLAERSLPKRPAEAPPKTPEIKDVEAPPISILPDMAQSALLDYKEKALPDKFLPDVPADYSSFSVFQPTFPDNPVVDLPDLPAYDPAPKKVHPASIESFSPYAAPIPHPAHTQKTPPLSPISQSYADDADADTRDPLIDYFKEDADDDIDFDGPTLFDDAANKYAKTHWSWVLGSMLLFFAAALQALYLFRVEVAQALPDVRPLMVQACGFLNCEIGLPQNSELLSIESSDLVADPQRPDEIELRATLRNRARHVQAYPNLDFNLTDAQDEILVKRIITPATYLKPPEAQRVGFAPNSEVNLKLQFKTHDVKPAGYRLLLFYP
ncbi:MAG: DUF3426 domain-containing protein [Burkholderiales bacterium]